MMNSISVVIPTYNEARYIMPCLASVAPQKALALECIVLDKSSDDTPKICTQNGWRVVSQKGTGVSNARQEGFDATLGDIIASTDADTVVSPHWLATIQSAFQDPDVVCVFGPVYLLDGPLWLQWMGNIGFSLFLWVGVLLGKPNVSGMNFAVKKSAYLQIGGFREELVTAEDVDLGLRIQKIGKVKYLHSLYVHTSARRLVNYGIAKFIWHHACNYCRMIFFGKASTHFEPIR